MVYILDIDEKPMMPTNRHGKVRRLLRDKKAKVVRATPFTIKLLYVTKTNVIQPLVLGIDPGSKTLSVAVRIENTPKVVYVSEIKVRNDISRKMKQRSMYRKNRRARKTRYREPRFLNRKRSERWLTPTLVSKINSHKKEIKYVFSILPISRVVLERNNFNTHRLVDPTVQGKMYQQGTLYTYENHRQYVLNRDRRQCKNCKKKNIPLQTHHVIFKSNKGKDHFSNLITLCDSCHKKVHKGTLVLTKKHLKDLDKSVNTLDATQITIISKRLEEFLERNKDMKNFLSHTTFGFETVVKRRFLRLRKEHYNDAISITYPVRDEYKFKKVEITNFYRKISISKGDYKQTFGSRSQMKIPTGKIHGFRKFDVVQYLGKRYIIKGRMSSGYAILMNSEMKIIKFKSTIKLNLLTRLRARNSTPIVKLKKGVKNVF